MQIEEAITDRLSYNGDTGLISRIPVVMRSNGRRFTHRDGVGCIKRNGYVGISVSVNGSARHFLAHRLAWYLAKGRWPIGRLDHVNGVRSDNRLVNLREASDAYNQANRHRKAGASTDLPVGIYRTARRGRPGTWYLVSCEYGESKRGTYKRDLVDAVKQRVAYENEMFPPGIVTTAQRWLVDRGEKALLHHVGPSSRTVAAKIRRNRTGLRARRDQP